MTILKCMSGLLLLASFAVVFQLSAQTPAANPAVAAPDTPGVETGAAGPHANTADQTFIRESSLGGRAEVDAGRLAELRSSSTEVKEFARRMVADHTKGNDSLTPLSKLYGVPLPKELDMDHQVMKGQLSKLQGVAFDKAYLQAQVIDHQKTAQLLEYEIGAGQSERVKAYANTMLPTVLDHLEHAQHLMAQLVGTTTRD
jgi:putative membrane protein